jgi:hypothetical protein
VSNLLKILDWLAWVITIPLQVVLAFIVGEFILLLGNREMPISIIQLWLTTTLSIFLIGALAISVRKSITPKKYLIRICFVALGVLLPLAILSIIGVAFNADNEIINSEPGMYLPLLAPILGTIGFYIPSPHKLILNPSAKKWRQGIILATLHTGPILLVGLALLIPAQYNLPEDFELLSSYFYILVGIWLSMWMATILYKQSEFE